MRYMGEDAEYLYLKCGHCKKICVYNKERFKNQTRKKCLKCKSGFRIVWRTPVSIKVPDFLCWSPFLIMTSLSLLVIIIICFPPFQRYYNFNKAITALNPLMASILIPALCSLMSVIAEIKPINKSKNKQEQKPNKNEETDGLIDSSKNRIKLLMVVGIESVVLIFIINVIIQTQYCCVEIKNPETGEIQQYFGGSMGDSASGDGRAFDSQGNLIYLGEFKNNLYNGYGEKWEFVETIHKSEVAESYQCVYKGNFKNGFPHGHGCEYRYDAEYDFEKEKGLSPYLYYEGEFVEGKYCGYGTLYSITMVYEGMFFEGEMNGYGRKWFLDTGNSNVYKMEATYINGVLDGAGKKYYPNGKLYFDGIYKDGKAISGSMYFINGSLQYEGKWNGNDYNGKGKLYWKEGNLRYDGSWTDNKRDGYGTSFREDGTLEYSGYWENDQYNGFGISYYEDGTTSHFDGYYKNGILDGSGTEYYRNGIPRYDGNWTSGEWNGEGIWYWENGKIYYEGDFEKGIEHGKGKIYTKDEVMTYNGEIIQGEKTGYGISYWPDGTIQYEGYWNGNKYSGEGIEYDEEGKVINEGKFEDGKLVSEK